MTNKCFNKKRNQVYSYHVSENEKEIGVVLCAEVCSVVRTRNVDFREENEWQNRGFRDVDTEKKRIESIDRVNNEAVLYSIREKRTGYWRKEKETETRKLERKEKEWRWHRAYYFSESNTTN